MTLALQIGGFAAAVVLLVVAWIWLGVPLALLAAFTAAFAAHVAGDVIFFLGLRKRGLV